MQAAESFEPGAYAQELRTMRELRRAFVQWFEPYDAMLLPSAAIPAMPVAEVDEASPIPGYLTRPANYLGLCGLSQPAGLVRGLPVSLQIVGKPFAERTVLSLGQAFESATEFHRQHPDLSSLGLD
jgi:aspartyl-tRNA(Asn)/glutamyl-tRNA(Gln) amidotransferase subunit A